MVSGRPFLYLSLPGVAFILGVFWYRRRNKNRIENDDESKDNKIKDAHHNANNIQNGNVDVGQKCNKLPNASEAQATGTSGSKSMNIQSNVAMDDESPTTKLFGKSAPIKIQNNGRTSAQTNTINSEILKTKIQDAENKQLRSIDEDFENLSSPVDLPDSVNNRISFYSRKSSSKADEPIVIKATRTPKISPENSFFESKYTKECEQNNNCEPIQEREVLPTTTTATMAALTPTTSSTSASGSLVYTQDALANDDDHTTIVKELDTNFRQKRNSNSASPSLSLCSNQSGDSGKGSSLPRSEATRTKTTYEFFFPTSLIGQLYGRKRSFINQIKAKTSANVVLSKNRQVGKVRICTIEGTESEVNAALAMIRQRLPVKRYPNFTMQRIHYALPQTVVPLSNESLFNLQLNLIEGINNDVLVSAVLSGSHIFVQHPLHPSSPALQILQKSLYDSYTSAESPLLPGIEISAVCIVSVNGIWYRVQIVDHDAEDEQRCIVKFLDFGGYMNVDFNDLRQIRSDYMGVPFQATECILSNIEPIDTYWSPEAINILSKLTKGIVLQAQVAGYNSHDVPEIYLFANLGPNNVIFINKELVARNLARWVEIQD